MTFGLPLAFLLLAIVPVLALLQWRHEVLRRKAVQVLVASRLQFRLAGNVHTGARITRYLLLLAGLALVIVALAKPRYGYVDEAVRYEGRDVIIAIDTSRSMLANDLAPNRLTRAKLAAQDLLRLLRVIELVWSRLRGAHFCRPH